MNTIGPYAISEAVRIPDVKKPLYHATGMAAIEIVARGGGIKTGGESKFGAGGAGGNADGVSMTTSFEVAISGSFGHTVLVLDANEISKKFKIVDRDYWGDDSEKEKRVIAKHIPIKYIKGMIVKKASGLQYKEYKRWKEKFPHITFYDYKSGKLEVIA